jgi:hypothetical protein
VGFANNVMPSFLTQELVRSYYEAVSDTKRSDNVGIGMTNMKCNWDECSICYPEKATAKNTNAPKEIYVTVTLAAATTNFKDTLEARTKNDKATIEVTFSPYGSKKTGTLSLYVPSAYGDGTYANVQLDGDDLKALQDAIYKVRVELAKSEVKNDEVYPF